MPLVPGRRAGGGSELRVDEEEVNAATNDVVAIGGLPVGPEAAAAGRGVERLIDQGWIKEHERVVVVITGDDRRYG